MLICGLQFMLFVFIFVLFSIDLLNYSYGWRHCEEMWSVQDRGDYSPFITACKVGRQRGLGAPYPPSRGWDQPLYKRHGMWLLLSCCALFWKRMRKTSHQMPTLLCYMFVKRWHAIQIVTLWGGIKPLLFCLVQINKGSVKNSLGCGGVVRRLISVRSQGGWRCHQNITLNADPFVLHVTGLVFVERWHDIQYQTLRWYCAALRLFSAYKQRQRKEGSSLGRYCEISV